MFDKKENKKSVKLEELPHLSKEELLDIAQSIYKDNMSMIDIINSQAAHMKVMESYVRLCTVGARRVLAGTVELAKDNPIGRQLISSGLDDLKSAIEDEPECVILLHKQSQGKNIQFNKQEHLI